MSTTSTETQYTAGRNAYASKVRTAVWLGTFVGTLAIIPTTFLGIITLPLISPITLWKSVDLLLNS